MPAKTTGQRTLRITFQIDDARGKLNDYQVVPLEPDAEVAQAAWRFKKKGMQSGEELEVYDVKLDEYGLSCDCRGFERFGYCKHSDSIRKLLGRLTATVGNTRRG